MKTRQLVTAAGLGLFLVLIFIRAASTAGAAGMQPGAELQSEGDELDTTGEQTAAAANTWYTETVDTGGVGLYTSLAMLYNIVQISYFDENTGTLLFAQSSEYQDWYTETVDTLGPGNASYTAVANDPSMWVTQISYHDINKDEHKHAVSGMGWITETANSPGGNYLDMVLDSSESPTRTVPHVSYYDQSGGDLIFARQDESGNWISTTVDSAGDVGLFTSIALDSLGNPNISYYDASNNQLNFATLAGSSWVTETVDSSGDVGWDTSIGIDSADNVHISYYDFTKGNLNYAFFNQATSSWITKTVDSTGDVGWYTSLALDSNDQPHISYYDFTNNSLSYASLEVSTWVTETVDASSADTGRFSALTIDYFDRPNISYYDLANGRLMYATNYPRPAKFTVNDNADGQLHGDINLGDGICLNLAGKCTLRAAIEEANAWPGESYDLIKFQSAMTITLSDILPGLTSTILLLGDDVWDYNKDQPGIKIDGNQLATGLRISSDECQITGLYLTNFSSSAIDITGGDNIIGGGYTTYRNVISGNGHGISLRGATATNNKIMGNYIGTTANGLEAQPNETGIYISGGASNNQIGGDTAAEGNLISGNQTRGVWIDGAGTDSNQLGGNRIGPDASGNASLPNNNGIWIGQGSGDTCIGCQDMASNTIRHNRFAGISISGAGDGTQIISNTIANNSDNGIDIYETSNCTIQWNTIYSNSLYGIRITEDIAADFNTISENSIYASESLGIYLDGSNNGIEAPTILNASSSSVTGTACPDCRVEVFSDNDDEGRVYHGWVQASSGGDWTYTGMIDGPHVTATATDADGNTSRFSEAYSDLQKPLIYLPLVLGGG